MLKLIIFANFCGFIHGVTVKSVQYKVQPESNSTTNLIECARLAIDSMYVAARKNDVTNTCESVDWLSGKAAETASGYTFIKKVNTTEIYKPPKELLVPTQWLLPGYFEVGSQIEFYFTMPTAETWGTFQVSVTDTLETELNYYTIYDDIPEILMIHIEVRKTDNYVDILTCKNMIWKSKCRVSPMPFALGQTYKWTFRPQSNVMEIYFDDVKVASFAHPTPPETARQLLFSKSGWPPAIVSLHNITFNGV